MSEIIEVKVGSKEAKEALFEFVSGREAGLHNIDNRQLWNYVENDEIEWKSGDSSSTPGDNGE